MNSLDFLKSIHGEDSLHKYFKKFGESLILDSRDQKWIEHYLKLQKFENTHAHTRVPDNYVQDDFRLGKWVSKQRQNQKDGRLLPYRRDLLNLCQGWKWKVQIYLPWEAWFVILKKYTEREGHARVPGGHIEDGHGLGGWVSVQRQAYQKGKLTKDRVRKLESLVGWKWQARNSWEGWFSRLKQFVNKEGHACVPQSYSSDGHHLGGWVSTQRHVFHMGVLSEDRIAKLESLPGWTWDASRGLPWERWFSLLQQFAKREGHSWVSRGHLENGKRLGFWVARQRQSYQSGALAKNQIDKLKSIKGWKWEAKQRWKSWFLMLQQFVKREGHSCVPESHKENGEDLGKWARRQQYAYRNGKLGSDQISLLESLPGWIWKANQTQPWEDWYSMLKDYALREGHACVPLLHVEKGQKLGQWVSVQRQDYQNKKFAEVRATKLESLPGWKWDASRGLPWDEWYSMLKNFAKRKGHSCVPDKHIESGFRLGDWVTRQRLSCREGTLSDGRIARLESLPGWKWDASRGLPWDEWYSMLKNFAKRKGHSCVPLSHSENGQNLGHWVGSQRQSYRTNKLNKDRATKLESLPGWKWKLRQRQSWDFMFSICKAYSERKGHACVPTKYCENEIRLGLWVNSQRQAYRKRKLAENRITKLKSLPGWKWEAFYERPWEWWFSTLCRYVEREGHACVPTRHLEKGKSLGQWVCNQRKAYKNEKLDQQQIVKLESLPGWKWNGSQKLAWNSWCRLLGRYAKREGHAYVPEQHLEKSKRLGHWCRRQRKAYHKGNLTCERIAKLESLPGWVWDASKRESIRT